MQLYGVRFLFHGEWRVIAENISAASCDRLIERGRELFPYKAFYRFETN